MNASKTALWMNACLDKSMSLSQGVKSEEVKSVTFTSDLLGPFLCVVDY